MSAGRVRERAVPPGAGVVGVVGARGGAGATVTAALLARSLARRQATVLVDTGPGPSLTPVLGIEALPGLRWPDLTGARGAVDPELLAANLARWGRCAVLPTDEARPGPPPPGVLPDVLDALAGAYGTVVLDLDRVAVLGARAGSGPGTAPDLAAACRTVLVVVPRDVPAVVGARQLGAELAERVGRTGVVTRGPAPAGLSPSQTAEAVGLPLLGRLPWVRGLAAAVDAGAGPAVPVRVVREIDRIAGRIT